MVKNRRPKPFPKIYLSPLPLNRARKYVRQTHRRLPEMGAKGSWMFWCIGAWKRGVVDEKSAEVYLRRQKKIQSGARKGSLSVETQEAASGLYLVGVAIVGPPRAFPVKGASADELPPPYARLEIVRVAVHEDNYNACSMLYGACSRVAKAMGCVDLLTYTEEDESGASLRASNYVLECNIYGQPKRYGSKRPGTEIRKRRWWAPWSEFLKRYDSY